MRLLRVAINTEGVKWAILKQVLSNDPCCFSGLQIRWRVNRGGRGRQGCVRVVEIEGVGRGLEDRGEKLAWGSVGAEGMVEQKGEEGSPE